MTNSLGEGSFLQIEFAVAAWVGITWASAYFITKAEVYIMLLHVKIYVGMLATLWRPWWLADLRATQFK